MSLLGFLLAGWTVLVLALTWVYRPLIVSLWREPSFRRPVLVLESDDWGAGPLAQVNALVGIGAVLEKYRDGEGRRPVLNLALVLAVPSGDDLDAIAVYRRLTLDATVFADVLDVLRQGAQRGLLALQLHGMEHFWPPTLLTSGDSAVVNWLRSDVPAATERLPSALQSRWVDASTLPSRPLPAPAVHSAVAEEVAAFRRIVGQSPQVVVPPTFVWTREVERAWSAQGIEFIVTPGWRSTLRNDAGLPDGDEGPIVNGDRLDGLTYLVRTDYFEPARGRDAAYALKALDNAVAQGRPCVLENHRDNFIFDAAQCQQSLAELDTLLAGALRRQPGLCFLATADLGRILRDADPHWVIRPWRERLPFMWQRLRSSGRLWKLMRLTGLGFVGAAVVRMLARPPSRPAAAS